MAWNDVKSSTNKAVHLLVSIAGHDFNFHQAVDVKVERKIGDTLSKFSLGIIDDSGSNQRSDYIEFERYIVQNFVNIDISYGNSATDIQKFSGFVVDYQPTFFGNTTKMTVSGYITRVNARTKQEYLTSPYSYWFDWTPYVGVRDDVQKDWDDLYEAGHLQFNEEMKTIAKSMGVSIESLSDKWAGNIIDDETMATINSVLNSESRTFNQTKNQYENSITSWLSNTDNLSRFFSSNGINSKSSLESVSIGLEQNNPSTVTITYRDYDSGRTQTITKPLSEFTTQAGMSATVYNSFTASESAYRKKLNLLLNLAKQDAIDAQDAQGDWKGVVPFREEIMSAYKGNIKTQLFTHPITGRSLSRVCPDLFVEWDRVVPMTDVVDFESINKDDRGKRAVTFSHHVACDITIFGLRFHCNVERLYSGDIDGAYTLYPQDRWGTYRVYQNREGKYFIWVGDCPELWGRYKAVKDYELQAQKTNYSFGAVINGQGNAPRQFSETTTYTKGERVALVKSAGDLYNIDSSTKIAEVLVTFQTDENPEMNGWRKFWDWWIEGTGYQETKFKGLKQMWNDAIINGQIAEVASTTTGEEFNNEAFDIRDYIVYALREKDGTKGFDFIEEGKPSAAERGDVVIGRDYRGRTVKMTREYRIKTYLQSAFRSAMPLAYGEVKISDIVRQLTWLEKWDDNEIVATTPSSYNSSFFFMNGQTALEYIATTLCPEAVEAGGGRVGYTCFFDKNKFVFRPANMLYTNGTVYETGYNRKDSDVLSFTVRSRGILLMQGVSADVANINAYTNENVAASSSKRGRDMSETEARLRKELVLSEQGSGTDPYDSFFNLPLYYYYGNSDTSIQDFKTFVNGFTKGVSISELPFRSQNMISTNKSSSSSSTEVVQTALVDLTKLRNTCIQAEMTIMGNTALSPGQWITVNNYTKRGPHYTSGDYFIQSITDQVSASGAFTQSLNMYRFSEDVSAMTTGNTHLETGISILQRYGQTRFEEWILNNYPDLARDYNITADTLGQTTQGASEILSGNEGKPFYKKINGVEFWGQGKLIEYDKSYNEAHKGMWATYFYADSNTYEILGSGSTVIEVGYISNYKPYTLKSGQYFDRYGNIMTPLN